MTSALYTGYVTHARTSRAGGSGEVDGTGRSGGRGGGSAHAFRYPIMMQLLDLDELPALDRRLRLFGYNRSRPLTLRDSDHLGNPRHSAKDNLSAFLEEQGFTDGVSRVLLLTQCRMLGYVFNPVSFFYCLDGRGALSAVVAEVRNTFGERHPYLLRCARDTGQDGGHYTGQEKKVFHVSPFMSLEGTYHFQLSLPDDHIDVRIDLLRQDRRVFASHLVLERQPLTDRTLAWTLLRFPFGSLGVVASIYWEALHLWRKGARYYPKPPYDPQAAHGGLA